MLHAVIHYDVIWLHCVVLCVCSFRHVLTVDVMLVMLGWVWLPHPCIDTYMYFDAARCGCIVLHVIGAAYVGDNN